MLVWHHVAVVLFGSEILLRSYHVKMLCSVLFVRLFLGQYVIGNRGCIMKSILQYGQAKLAQNKAKSFSTCASVAVSAGQALRDGYKLRGYVRVENGTTSYWRKSKD